MTMVFTDEDGLPLVPTTVDWRLDDKTNGAEVVAWTSLVGPASTVVVTVPGSNNVIDNEEHVVEKHVFGVRVDDGLAGEAYAELTYNVANLSGPAAP
ncbi:hypothetical protein LCGC14_1101320 [marine sediment metagenome]|uniref:Uncharacterized protein n=1 Tax=marine sediment metagenome TaxID=412755 RepID=A0A0F9M9D9_9ZZZZ